MLVLNTRLSLLASLLTLLILSSAPTSVSAVAVLAREDSDGMPSSTTDGTTFTQSPFHQDRPSDLGLPEGTEPDSSASRKGMGKWNANKGEGYSRTWTGTWTGTRTGARSRPTRAETASGPPGDSESDELSKREHSIAKAEGAPKAPHRRFARRSLASKHGKASSNKHTRDISIDDDRKGSHYVVQKSKATGPPAKKAYSVYAQRRFLMRRKIKKGTPGIINIMSHVNNAQLGKKIASLYLEADQKADSTYVLNASEKDSTEIYLVPAVPSDGGSRVVGAGRRRREDSSLVAKKEMLVNLRMEINKATYCATYDPNPPEAEPLTMQPCMDDAASDDFEKSSSDVDAAKDTDPNNHKSQTFSFDPDSGVIRPMWFAGEDDGKTDDDSDMHAQNSDESDSDPTTTASADATSSSSASPSDGTTAADLSASPSLSATSEPSAAPAPSPTVASREPSGSHAAQNVTLVFVPSSKPSAEASEDAPTASESSSASMPSSSSTVSDVSPSASAVSDNDDSSMIVTKTVTVTASAAGETGSVLSSTTTGGALAAAATGDKEASSTTTITISASALQTASPSSASQGTMNVQVVGDDGKTVGDDDPNTADPSASVSGSAAATPAASSAGPSISMSLPIPTSIIAADTESTTTDAPASTPPAKVDPMAVASGIAQFWSASQPSSTAAAEARASSPPAPPSSVVTVVEATASSSLSESSSAVPAPTSTSEVVAVKSRVFNSRIARRAPMMTAVSTAPYKWLFKLAGI
ncbi:hypothetical protein DFP72DRAFT_631690 [Ephemerocybe angulata]|uniref:Uncharacterized protein n=1 Tax=Ephemerocybe angulata TaxID=980116 RepID=A0A8H6MDF5_9AGAR|nr:hypothetical protein DFP72DRAFT_631690 [Tulosesus angulatus]